MNHQGATGVDEVFRALLDDPERLRVLPLAAGEVREVSGHAILGHRLAGQRRHSGPEGAPFIFFEKYFIWKVLALAIIAGLAGVEFIYIAAIFNLHNNRVIAKTLIKVS